MLHPFLKYFFKHIFKSKTHQGLLLLALVGLFLSSFSLIVLQSTMSGLQNEQMTRSKKVQGYGVLEFEANPHDIQAFLHEIKQLKAKVVMEYERELLLRHGKFLAPVNLHGVAPLFDASADDASALPHLQGRELEGLILPLDLASRVDLSLGDQVMIIDPAHSDSLLGEVPRQSSEIVKSIIMTDVPEVDNFHAWTRLAMVQNLAKKRTVNRLRFFNAFPFEKITSLLSKYQLAGKLKSWEDMNQTLVWALRLESTVMVFLFTAMTTLVGLCITSGLLIFFDKVKIDFVSFWILGAGKKEIVTMGRRFLAILGGSVTLIGLLAGLLFLYLLDHYAPEVMPEVFVDRSIPVNITVKSLVISTSVPMIIFFIFSEFSFSQYRKLDYISYLRNTGR